VLSPAATRALASGVSCVAPCLHEIATGGVRPWEPMIAVDRRDPLHVVVANTVFEGAAGTPVATSWIETHATTDGGATWRSMRLVAPSPAQDAMGDAFVTFLPDGTPLVAGLAFTHAGLGPATAYASARTAYSFFVARSSDGGVSWEAPVVVRAGRGALALALAPAPVGEQAAAAGWDANDKEWIAVAPDGTLLATWAQIETIDPPDETLSRQDLVASTSRDGGRSWSAPALVEKGGQWLGAAPAALPDGTMAVAYLDVLSLDLHVATSRDHGATWKPRALGKAAFFPALAASASRLVLAYPASNETAPDAVQMDAKPQRVAWRVYDDGATWSDARVADWPEAPGRATPRLASLGSGDALLTWLHGWTMAPSFAPRRSPATPPRRRSPSTARRRPPATWATTWGWPPPEATRGRRGSRAPMARRTASSPRASRRSPWRTAASARSARREGAAFLVGTHMAFGGSACRPTLPSTSAAAPSKARGTSVRSSTPATRSTRSWRPTPRRRSSRRSASSRSSTRTCAPTTRRA
jgi:hypothetical protein